MRLNHFLVLLLPVVVLCNRSPLVEIEQGKIRGVITNPWKGRRFYSFLKVPYAKPPIDELRFKDPQPAEKWNGILEAMEDMPECVQFNNQGEIIGQEDCLYMNIHTQQVSGGMRPVMVWLHGGGWLEGNGKLETYGPQFLVPEGVVLVTVQYRLGFFGFLNFDNPKVGVPGNAGLKDQVMALKWVRNNIKAFGGDPNSVTLFGESVGGASTHMHMLSPLSKGLFHKVISQSGTALNIWNEGAKNTGILALEVLEYPTDDEKKVLDYLQTVSVEDIMQVQERCSKILPISERPLVGPVVETLHKGDIFLAESPEDILLRGKFSKIPYMLGYNNNEALMLYAFDMVAHGELKTIPLDDIVPFQIEVKDEEAKHKITQRIKKQYSIVDHQAGTNEYTQLLSDVYITHGVYRAIVEHSDVHHKDLYLYKFSADTKLNFIKLMDEFTAEIPGAAHEEELGYLFKKKSTPEDLTQDSIEGKNIIRIVKLWSNFAKYGNPTPKEKELGITWKPVTRDTMHYLDITTDSLSMKSNPFDKSNMHFWDKLLGKRVKYEHSEL